LVPLVLGIAKVCAVVGPKGDVAPVTVMVLAGPLDSVNPTELVAVDPTRTFPNASVPDCQDTVAAPCAPSDRRSASSEVAETSDALTPVGPDLQLPVYRNI
jgi:hypothetical protein